jgi:hypothetical protein
MANNSLSEIKDKVLAYYKKMNEISDYLQNSEAPVQIIKDKEFIGFFLTADDLAALNTLMSDPGSQYVAVLFGLEDNKENNKVTACFLAANAEKQISSIHKGEDPVPGQESWIVDTGLTLASSSRDVNDFLS